MLNRFARFSLAIAEIHRCWHKLAAEEMAKYDLNSAHAFYLTTLIQYPEGITAARLCEICEKDKAAISRIVAELEEAGLVQRLERNGTRYRATLVLTPSGREAAEVVSRTAKWAVERAGEGLTDADREVFYRVLALIAENLHAICKDGLRSE